MSSRPSFRGSPSVILRFAEFYWVIPLLVGSQPFFLTMVVSRIFPLGRLTSILSPWKRTGTEAPGPNSPGKIPIGRGWVVLADVLPCR